MIAQFLYTRLVIPDSTIGIDTKKDYERVPISTPKITATKRVTKVRGSPWIIPVSILYMSHILKLVKFQLNLPLQVTSITQKIFLTISMKFCGSSPTCDHENSR